MFNTGAAAAVSAYRSYNQICDRLAELTNLFSLESSVETSPYNVSKLIFFLCRYFGRVTRIESYPGKKKHLYVYKYTRIEMFTVWDRTCFGTSTGHIGVGIAANPPQLVRVRNTGFNACFLDSFFLDSCFLDTRLSLFILSLFILYLFIHFFLIHGFLIEALFLDYVQTMRVARVSSSGRV